MLGQKVLFPALPHGLKLGQPLASDQRRARWHRAVYWMLEGAQLHIEQAGLDPRLVWLVSPGHPPSAS